MARFDRILIPIELVPASIGTAQYAAALARSLSSEMVFLHVPEGMWPLGGDERSVRSRIMRIAADMPFRFLTREGTPAEVILETALSEGADLILMPTGGANAMLRFAGRSVTAKVMSEARCPVWSGRGDLASAATEPIRRILCGLTTAVQSGIVLRYATALSEKLKASLTLIHADRALARSRGIPCESERLQHVSGVIREELMAAHELEGKGADLRLEGGRTLTVVADVAERIDADLLVVGKSPAKRYLADFRMTSFELIRRTACPVVSV